MTRPRARINVNCNRAYHRGEHGVAGTTKKRVGRPAKASKGQQDQQRPARASRGQQRPAEASRGQQRPAEASRGQQRPAEASRGQQRPAEASRGWVPDQCTRTGAEQARNPNETHGGMRVILKAFCGIRVFLKDFGGIADVCR